MGLGTLLLVVGKLFVVDLAAVGTIWRIALFLGFGVVFLVLSYFNAITLSFQPTPVRA